MWIYKTCFGGGEGFQKPHSENHMHLSMYCALIITFYIAFWGDEKVC